MSHINYHLDSAASEACANGQEEGQHLAYIITITFVLVAMIIIATITIILLILTHVGASRNMGP